MAISLFGGRRSDDPFDSLLFDPFSFSSLMRFPDHPSFARDVAAVANTQVDWKETSDSHIFKANLPGLAKEDVKVQPGRLALKIWESEVSFQSTCVLATAATSRAKEGWSGKRMREEKEKGSKSKESKGSSLLRPPKREIAIVVTTHSKMELAQEVGDGS
ncbi:hypothetical protein GOP47_0005817 [Adiantum capillus-veneris]|uniref:SHSP domain-containing protein n=1 Tax=Adiantum capillus-veneris TaxID=13818 RepID=A0A9D4V637_ADICA|nr:hypothetical protein GOP47_0005817 [Adiantum capillus-veneris]